MRTLTKLFLVAISLSLLPSDHLSAQLDFTDRSDLLPDNSLYSWMQKGVSDVNGDHLDDIIVCNTSGEMFILLQQKDGSFVENALGTVEPGSNALSVIVADVDNNNHDDILTGGQYNGVRVTKSMNPSSTYQTSELPSSNIFTQSSAFGDIDGDGYVDIYASHDEGMSGIWRNNGDGTFVKDYMGIDLSTVPVSDESGNYGIVFTDFDLDNDLDFYVSKCRTGVNSPSDPRRINRLFENDGNNNYEDKAGDYGMASGAQTWITDFQDIDNDGDFDMLMINHYEPSVLLENNGDGSYTDISVSSGLSNIPDATFESVMRDFDNDGYVDLITAGGNGPRYYKNNGNKTFTAQNIGPLSVGSQTIRSFAVGDLNNDGFYDLYGSYYWGSASPDRLWINEKNSNHYLPIHLLGYQGNRSAVGAKVFVEVGGKTILREVRSGEGYGLSHSHCLIIGLGNATSVDEVRVVWPDGKEARFNNVKIDEALYIIEGFK